MIECPISKWEILSNTLHKGESARLMAKKWIETHHVTAIRQIRRVMLWATTNIQEEARCLTKRLESESVFPWPNGEVELGGAGIGNEPIVLQLFPHGPFGF